MPQDESAASQLSADSLTSALRLFDQGRLSEAAPLFQQLLRRQPNHAVALHRLGLIAQQLRMPDHAIRLLRHSLRAGGESPELLNDLGSVFVDTEDLENARRCFGRCIDRYPGSALGYVSLAYLENQNGEFEKAESLYIAAIDRANHSFEAKFNLATLYRERGYLSKAVRLYDALIIEHPSIPLLADGRARALLQQRNWRDGWEAYEARFLLEDEPARINLDLPVPRWQGESLIGKHLLVVYEQGVGDEVQFASCYADAIARASRCTITCSPRLQPIFHRAFPDATFVEVAAEDREAWRPQDDSAFDYVVPAGSLPRFFRNNDSDFTGMPFLDARGNADNGLRVGVSWWGGTVADQIRKRSIPFEIFQRLFDVADVEFVNLQHGCRSDKAKHELAPFVNLSTSAIDPYQELESWFDLLASLDLLISVDNSNVHFAGALGVPTWLLLADHPNWRWPQDSDVSPWYDSVQLVRKSPRKDWTETIEEVAMRLAQFAETNKSRSAA